MKRGGGKAKGSAFERTVGAILTGCYYPDGDGLFRRIYSHPIPRKDEVRGDLVALRYYKFQDSQLEDCQLILDKSFPFCIECKNYKDVRPVFSGLYSSQSAIFDWMQQSRVVADIEKKMPLVVFKLYRTAIVAMLDRKDFTGLQELFGLPGFVFYVLTWRAQLCKDPIISAGSEAERTLVFMLLSDLLEWIDWGVYKISDTRKYIRSLLPKREGG